MILLSILIPSIPHRIDKMKRLFERLQEQIGDKNIEVLSFLDNKKRSIGLKRDALVQLARGSTVHSLTMMTRSTTATSQNCTVPPSWMWM